MNAFSSSVNCPSCGLRIYSPERDTCPSCGASLNAESSETEPQPIKRPVLRPPGAQKVETSSIPDAAQASPGADSTAPAGETDGGALTTNVLFGTLIVLLITILLAGSALAKVHIDRRDSVIGSLSRGNVAQQEHLDQLRADADELALEYAEMSAVYEDMNEHFLPLQEEFSDMEAELESTREDLAERDRQLSLAREEGSREQERADVAEYLSWVLLDILLIDEEIHAEYEILVDNVVQMNEYMLNGQYGAADEAYARASGAMDRLDELFQEREDIIAEFEDEE